MNRSGFPLFYSLLGMIAVLFLVWNLVGQKQQNEKLAKDFAAYKIEQQTKLSKLAEIQKPKPVPTKINVNGYTYYKESDPALILFQALLSLHDPRVKQVLKKFDIKLVDLNKKQQFP